MTGKQLYALYVAQHALQNCEIEAWDELTTEDQQVWEGMATGVRDMYGV